MQVPVYCQWLLSANILSNAQLCHCNARAGSCITKKRKLQDSFTINGLVRYALLGQLTD